MSSEDEKRIAYCKEHNVHHLFELMASRLLIERPTNPFEYLRHLLANVEESEQHRHTYDPTVLPPSFPPASATAQPLRKITIGTFGLDNAGKTTLIAALSGQFERNAIPTVGFAPTRFQTEKYDVCIFDLGGAANFRGIWVHYFHDCHGFMFVMDSAAAEATVREALGVFRDIAQHRRMRGKPVLLLANKKDVPCSKREAVLPDGFLPEVLAPDTAHRVVASCAIAEDAEVEAGVEWLLETIAKNYAELEKRVEADTMEEKAEAKRKLAQRLAARDEEA